ncbi:MAG: type II toxin-antitoxin system HicA family toxin [Calditrichota bacterium]
MTTKDKLIWTVLSGQSDNDISFDRLCNLMTALGFNLRVRGDHHIFYRQDIPEILNLQPKQGKAKAYQVKQVRNLIVKYKLGVGRDD